LQQQRFFNSNEPHLSVVRFFGTTERVS
jgi:hypothetical protein